MYFIRPFGVGRKRIIFSFGGKLKVFVRQQQQIALSQTFLNNVVSMGPFLLFSQFLKKNNKRLCLSRNVPAKNTMFFLFWSNLCPSAPDDSGKQILSVSTFKKNIITKPC